MHEEFNESKFFSSLDRRSTNLLRANTSDFRRGLGSFSGADNEEEKEFVRHTSMTYAQNKALEENFTLESAPEEVWFLPKLPEGVEEVNIFDKRVAMRTSYQYLHLKQKIYSVFEDKEEANKLILGELMLYP